MPKGEIQNRDRDETSNLTGIPLAGTAGRLGELSDDLAIERGDLAGYALRAAAQATPDMASAQVSRVDAAETGVGSPKIDYGVRSIYDSRPVNSKDFNLWFQRSIGAHGDPLDYSFAQKLFYVPQGYVAVLRECVIIIPPPVTLSNYDGTLEVMVNGSTVDPVVVTPGEVVALSTPDQISIPWRSNAPVKTFVIADEGNSIGLKMTVQGAPTLTESQLQIGFFGQFLLKTGVPAQFQAANEAGRSRTAVVASRSDLAMSTPSDGISVRRRQKVPFPNVPILRR